MAKKRVKKGTGLILARLSRIERKLDRISSKESSIGKEEKKIEKNEEKIEKEELKTENVLLRIRNFEFKRKHLLEIVRGTAGAFLGVGLGKSILGLDALAKSLAWLNIFGILAFVIILSALLIYKSEKAYIAKEGKKVIFRKLLTLYVLSLVVEVIALFLFGGLPGSAALLVKTVIIGSYPAMAGAVSFSIS